MSDIDIVSYLLIAVGSLCGLFLYALIRAKVLQEEAEDARKNREIDKWMR